MLQYPEPKTPVNNKNVRSVMNIPPSPFLTKLGYGTGVAVYKLDRAAGLHNMASPWAIKKLLKTDLKNSIYGKRLNEEATILKKLQHPNIVGFRGYLDDINGKKCLAMEECSASLGDLIEVRADNEAKAFPVKNIFKVAWDITNALNYLHNEALLLHCDIKSYNILIKDDFAICKLCDFGVSVPLNADGTVAENQTSKIVGTESWSAPEILKQLKEITSKADIYSFGLVFWEMLALQPPAIWSDEASFVDLEDSGDSSILEKRNCRPDVPNQDFEIEYNYVLELFYCCTSELAKERPLAKDLMVIIPDMIKDLKYDELLQ